VPVGIDQLARFDRSLRAMAHGWLVLSVSPRFTPNGYFLFVLICMDKKEKRKTA
jgi:hypothetical protein